MQAHKGTKNISTSTSKEFLGSPKCPNLAVRNANNLLGLAIEFQAVVTETVPLTIATGLYTSGESQRMYC